MNYKKMKFFFVCISLVTTFFQLPINLNGQQNIRLASVLQNNMVIQQGKPFTVWGKTLPNNIINVECSWLSKKFITSANEEGKFSLEIPVSFVKNGNFTKHHLTVFDKDTHIDLSNLLIGEVWFCSGQSNMEMSMQPAPPWHKGVVDFEKEIAAANMPNLRLYKAAKQTSINQLDTCVGKWESCTPETVALFSGVAYYFGRKLLMDLNIPIGLVESAIGSASCQSFINREVLFSDTVLRKTYLEPYDKNPTEKIPVLCPSLVYNAMIHALMPFSIKGILWYQGESNAGEFIKYPRLFTALINSWRKEFNQGSIPFYFVQMTPYNWKKNDSSAFNYALFRASQSEVLKMPNTAMVSTMDIGEPDNIHPRQKKVVGERLAIVALNRNYKQRHLISEGPIVRNIQFNESRAIIHFKKATIKSGLSTNDGLPPKHFYLAGEDKVFHLATACINANRIYLTSNEVKYPKAIRYAFTNYPVTNFQNNSGFSANPFRTDNW